jgi:hypothetical protein
LIGVFASSDFILSKSEVSLLELVFIGLTLGVVQILAVESCLECDYVIAYSPCFFYTEFAFIALIFLPLVGPFFNYYESYLCFYIDLDLIVVASVTWLEI